MNKRSISLALCLLMLVGLLTACTDFNRSGEVSTTDDGHVNGGQTDETRTDDRTESTTDSRTDSTADGSGTGRMDPERGSRDDRMDDDPGSVVGDAITDAGDAISDAGRSIGR